MHPKKTPRSEIAGSMVSRARLDDMFEGGANWPPLKDVLFLGQALSVISDECSACEEKGLRLSLLSCQCGTWLTTWELMSLP
jgi:hypothetical protein